MITASQVLGVLLGNTILSALFVLIYWLQEVFSVEHRQRLKFLKVNLLVTWLATMASVVILSLNAGKSIGSLFPATELLSRSIVGSKARILIFESDRSSMSRALLGIYLIGVFIMLLRFLQSYFQMRRVLLNSTRAQISGRDIRVVASVTSPFSFGFFNPQIFVPSQFLTEQSLETVDVMLTHEEIHLKHRDPQWKLFSLLTRAALFFAPSAFLLHRKLELEMEIECDLQTMRKTKLQIGQYGNLLIDTVVALQSSKPNPMFTYMSNTNLRKRIEAMKAKTSNRPGLTIVFGSLVLAASATAIAATSGVSKFKGQYKVKTEILLDGKVISSPQFIVLPNEPASLEMKAEHPQAALRMMLTASDFSNAEIVDGIDLTMAVDYKTQDRSFRANPRVVVAPGEEGIVTIGSDANDTLEMRIKAERQ
jgi:beta-lactamase regulating signal transducer with metallopeptidase domain